MCRWGFAVLIVRSKQHELVMSSILYDHDKTGVSWVHCVAVCVHAHEVDYFSV